MTEDEAESKWCPFARVALDVTGGSFNRWTGGEAVGETSPSLCIASACMAWRWTPSHGPDPENPKGDLVLHRTTWGVCGLAGQP